MTTPRKPLAGIVTGSSGSNNVLDQFDTIEAAEDFGPLPKGVYIALAVGGKIDKARTTGTDYYVVEFQVIEGTYARRRLWLRNYLTEAALQYAKRDLAKLGINTRAKLAAPFPANRMVCKLTVSLRQDDNKTEWNEITNFEVIRVQEPTVDPFAPKEDEPGDQSAEGKGDTSFPFGANATEEGKS